MPNYRLIFPVAEGVPSERRVGAHRQRRQDLLGWRRDRVRRGERRRVSQAPLEDPTLGQTADLMLWPAD